MFHAKASAQGPAPLRRTLLTAASLGAGAAWLGQPVLALAQGDARPLRLILPVGAGSGVDVATRAFAQALSRNLGAPVVVENLPGAGGVTGTQALVRAPKDGSVLGVLSNNHVVNPAVYKSLPYDSLADITPLMVIGAVPLVLVAHPSFAPRNLAELVALAKARPGQLNYASSGNGTIIQLAFEALKMATGIFVTHIPYRSMGQALTDVISNQVPMVFAAASIVQQHLRSGSLKALGVSTAQRSPTLPDVPTLAEQGATGYDLGGWIAVAGPAGLGVADTQRLHAALLRTLQTGEARDALVAQGYQLRLSSPQESAQFFRTEVQRMAQIVKAGNVKAD